MGVDRTTAGEERVELAESLTLAALERANAGDHAGALSWAVLAIGQRLAALEETVLELAEWAAQS